MYFLNVNTVALACKKLIICNLFEVNTILLQSLHVPRYFYPESAVLVSPCLSDVEVQADLHVDQVEAGDADNVQ